MRIAIDPSATLQDVAIVTGPSGAGRSTAINALEDLGFEAIDNLPMSLLERLFAGGAHERPLAVGIDARTRGFSADSLMAAVEALTEMPQLNVSLVYVDCDTDTLLRRFSETRRRHPLAPNETPLVGIERERGLLGGLRERADILVDTSQMPPHELRAELWRWFGRGSSAEMAVSVQSFSFKRGTPRGADMVLDCRFLRNPHWKTDLRPLTGSDPAVADHVVGDPLYQAFHDKTLSMLELLLPAYKAEGKSYFTLALGCTGGRHRSVCVAERLSNGLANAGWQVSIRHRELERTVGGRALKDVVEL
ncbi:RNase adapter RapZ [Rhodobacteraceae bacterium 2CG4]|uniref:RNase adapter RapZ n=1 Tax=Halovulum marinum TaxID=2662447 RepID=A0A6L5YW32_9RHOB|nr:RNase adapter RapZ [Halovulum marinum]MSU88129.1 RNase adapter RapZ [Halovulum marinum]